MDDDDVRARRLARLAARHDDALPTANPQEGRAMRARAAATDREARFAARLERVRVDSARQARRKRRREVLETIGTGVLGLVVLVVAGRKLDLAVAVALALAASAVAHGGRRLAARLAQARGAEAWDWQAGRHRLMGNPAARVQQADAPPPTDPRA